MEEKTSKTPWTPGPWYVCTEPTNDSWYPGRTIGSVPDRTRIADVTSLRKKEQAFADAHLLASAPALYEALEKMLAHSCVADAHPEDKFPEDHEAEYAALRALSAARGETKGEADV